MSKKDEYKLVAKLALKKLQPLFGAKDNAQLFGRAIGLYAAQYITYRRLKKAGVNPRLSACVAAISASVALANMRLAYLIEQQQNDPLDELLSDGNLEGLFGSLDVDEQGEVPREVPVDPDARKMLEDLFGEDTVKELGLFEEN